MNGRQSLSPNEVVKRLMFLLDCFESDKQTQAVSRGEPASFRFYGIGFDRWHFLQRESKPIHLISLWHVNQFIYINDIEFPCPVTDGIKFIGRYDVLCKFSLYEGSKHEKYEGKKETKRKTKLEKLQGHLDAAREGRPSGSFANPLSKKRRGSKR